MMHPHSLPAKRPYKRPALRSFGSLRSLTQGGTQGPDPDGQSGMGMN